LHERYIPAADLFGPAATAAACGAIVDAFNARHAPGSIVIFIVLVGILIIILIVLTLVRPLTTLEPQRELKYTNNIKMLQYYGGLFPKISISYFK
jgi:hypothetical protein